MSEFYGDRSINSEEDGVKDERILMTWVDNGAFGDNNPGSDTLKEKYPEFFNKWVQWGEYVYIEFNPTNGTARLVPIEEANK